MEVGDILQELFLILYDPRVCERHAGGIGVATDHQS